MVNVHSGGNPVNIISRIFCCRGAGSAHVPMYLLPLCLQFVCLTLYFCSLLCLCHNGSSYLYYFEMSCQSFKCLTQCWDIKGKHGKYFMNYSVVFWGFHGLRARKWPHTSKAEWQRFLSWWLMTKKATIHPLISNTFKYLTHTCSNIIFISQSRKKKSL